MTIELNSIVGTMAYSVSQSLMIPVIIVLAIFLIYALINSGILLAEYYKRRKVKFDLQGLISQILSARDSKDPETLILVIETNNIPKNYKKGLINLIMSNNTSPEFRESLAIKMVEDEGMKVAKKLEKTDIIAKISPAVGLMGTLIPLGPGLTALGAGNIQELANHLTTAFDAAILGMAAAAIAFTISKIRRRWYEEELSNLETIIDTVLEVL